MPRSPRTAAPPRTRTRAVATRRRRVVRVAVPVEPVADEEVVYIPADPKEALIRKHTTLRARKTGHGFSLGYAVMVGVILLLVVAGWWFTLDRNLSAQQGMVDPEEPGVTDILQNGMQQFRTEPQAPVLVPPPSAITPETTRTPSAFEQRLQNAQ